MGHKSTLQDLKDVHPAVHDSLQKLLAEPNVSDLGLVFQVSQQLLHHAPHPDISAHALQYVATCKSAK